MSKIYFWTPSELDLNCVRLMGVSSKQCDSPIGRFGTGLKFAIANILRTGGGFTITINNAPYHFTTQEQAIRGVDSVDVVVMNGEALGFTTSLGKHWEGWMILRELYSNTKDEGGELSFKYDNKYQTGTLITVEDEYLYEVIRRPGEVYLEERDPVYADDDIEMYNTPSEYVYYQGIRIVEENTLMTYNIKSYLDLTEDRTPKYSYKIEEAIERCIAKQNAEFSYELLNAENKYCEAYRSFMWVRKEDCGQEFIDILSSLTKNPHVNTNMRAVDWFRKNFTSNATLTPIEPDEVDKKKLTEAMALISAGGHLNMVNHYECIVVEELGTDTHGLARDGRIYISKEAFKLGVPYLAATIFEEAVHLKFGYKDESRAMQNYLFHELASCWERF